MHFFTINNREFFQNFWSQCAPQKNRLNFDRLSILLDYYLSIKYWQSIKIWTIFLQKFWKNSWLFTVKKIHFRKFFQNFWSLINLLFTAAEKRWISRTTFIAVLTMLIWRSRNNSSRIPVAGLKGSNSDKSLIFWNSSYVYILTPLFAVQRSTKQSWELL